MTKRLLELLRRGWRNPPHVIVRWLSRQARAELDQHLAPGRARRLTRARLLKILEAENINALWERAAETPFTFTEAVSTEDYERTCPGDSGRILAAAEDVVARRVDLLGSGPVDLGTPIDWHTDFKSGHGWPKVAFRRIDAVDLGRPSDVKVPWELSRLQWLIPAGQAYLLTGDERYAQTVRGVIEEWIEANPYAIGVNWACTMDVAIRGISLCWLFHTFHDAKAWADDGFRFQFLRQLYLHGDFTSRHLEWSDVNGNHLLADAAGLTIFGLFFGNGAGPRQWQQEGWQILSDELPRQVFADGVDFEASTAYHRLVLELFLLPALYRRARGFDIPSTYSAALSRMATFAAAYSRHDGTSPLWGDADDGRALPFGPQAMTDHRYLIAQVGLAFDDSELLATASGPMSEVFWLLGSQASAIPKIPATVQSQAFPHGGVYVMRSVDDHVFIDCGPVGMAGRGGHGHNDCLSLEVSLAGVNLITDCGTFVYSADPNERNRFRATAAHNTPIIDEAEQNRFVRPEYLWSLHDDAAPQQRHWSTCPEVDQFVGAHSGYQRLPSPVTPVRAVSLEKDTHRLTVIDRFEGSGDHAIRIPYHLDAGVSVGPAGTGLWRLTTEAGTFLLAWRNYAGWESQLEDGWVSPSYGVKHKTSVLTFSRTGPLEPLMVGIMPEAAAPNDPHQWLMEAAVSLSAVDAG
jgi:hypothetical protein